MSALVLKNVSVARGGTQVVRQVSLTVPQGSITVLLGPNGAGKSTLLDAIAGLLPTQEGSIQLGQLDLADCSARQRFAHGVAYVEQGRTIFPKLSVKQNIEAAAASAQSAREALSEVLGIFPELQKRLDVAAGMLSGGEQQMIVLGRALINRPKVLLIDELSLGLAPVVVSRFMPLLTGLREQGVAVLLVEQYANAALGIGDQAVILAHGETVMNESCARLKAEPRLLQEAYLG
jgi:branched-chain amino acid transport system ATP-binding protein